MPVVWTLVFINTVYWGSLQTTYMHFFLISWPSNSLNFSFSYRSNILSGHNCLEEGWLKKELFKDACARFGILYFGSGSISWRCTHCKALPEGDWWPPGPCRWVGVLGFKHPGKSSYLWICIWLTTSNFRILILPSCYFRTHIFSKNWSSWMSSLFSQHLWQRQQQ